MSSTTNSFRYPPLPDGVDAIRLLNLEPGDFHDTLTCTLATVAFRDKPKYVALSYTWGDSYHDNARLPITTNRVTFPQQSPSGITEYLRSRSLGRRTDHKQTAVNPQLEDVLQSRRSPRILENSVPVALIINGHSFRVGHNLYLALLHLRSPKTPLTLWADAICINSEDTEERNAQVAMMSFIYPRALNVVAWLGTKEYRGQSNLFRCMSIDWKAGRSQHLASSVADGSKPRCSFEPDLATFARIAQSSYWTRLWIVQEVCRPQRLTFVYGSSIWTDEDFSDWAVKLASMLKRSQPIRSTLGIPSDVFDAMFRLLGVRSSKHTDDREDMMLEKLIERFAKSGCVELRDKVYGLLGLANDIRPFSRKKGSFQSDENDTKPRETLLDNVDESPRGKGSLEVDYSRSFYNIWTDVIKFIFFQAKDSTSNLALGDTLKSSGLSKCERRLSIVKAAGLLQEVLGQRVEEEIAESEPSEDKTVIGAIGFVLGEIVHLGPGYNSLIAEVGAQQDWIDSWYDHYHEAEDMATLRIINEEFTTKIVNYDRDYLAKLRQIRSPRSLAWRTVEAAKLKSLQSFHIPAIENARDNDDGDDKGELHSLRICLGTNRMVALVPPTAKVGDIIAGFEFCNAAIVLRSITPPASSESAIDNSTSPFMLVGRADVVEDPTSGIEKSSQSPDAIFVKLDLSTLQMITASASIRE